MSLAALKPYIPMVHNRNERTCALKEAREARFLRERREGDRHKGQAGQKGGQPNLGWCYELEHSNSPRRGGFHDLKSAQLRIGNEVDLLTQEEIHLQVRLDRAQARLQSAVERFVALDHQAVPALLAVLTARGRTMVENVMPPLPMSETAVPKVEKGTRLGQGVQVSTAPVRRSRRSRSRVSPM